MVSVFKLSLAREAMSDSGKALGDGAGEELGEGLGVALGGAGPLAL